MAKKTIFVHLYNDRSGSPKVLSQIIRTFIKFDLGAELITSRHENGFLSDLPCETNYIFYKRSENKLITLLCYALSQLNLFFYSLRYWRDDATFYVNTMMPCGAALAAKVMGKRVIYHIHETSLRPQLLKLALRFAIKLTANKIIFVSKYLSVVEGFENKDQHVVHNAIEDRKGELNIKKENKNFNVLMICSLKQYKGVPEFFALASHMAPFGDVKFTLILNADRSEIDDYLLSHPAPSNISIHSRQSDTDTFYSKASVVLNLSRPDEWIETFGLTIIEAMSHGLPVIVPPVGGPAEIVSDNHNGFLVSCYQTDIIANKILLLKNQKLIYDELSINAKLSSQNFTLNSFEKNILDAIAFQG